MGERIRNLLRLALPVIIAGAGVGGGVNERACENGYFRDIYLGRDDKGSIISGMQYFDCEGHPGEIIWIKVIY